MSVEQLYKATLVCLQKHKESVIDELHNAGIMHITPLEKVSNHTLPMDDPSKKFSEVSELLLELEWIKEHLHIEDSKVYTAFRKKAYADVIQEAKDIKKELHKEVQHISSEESAIQQKREKLGTELALLKAIPFALEAGFEGKRVTEQTFTLLVRESEPLNFANLHLSIIKENEFLLVQGLKSEFAEVESIISKSGAEILPITLQRNKKEEIKAFEKEFKENEEAHRIIVKKREMYKKRYTKKISAVNHDLEIFLERYEVSTQARRTEESAIFTGFISKRDKKKIEKITKHVPVHTTLEIVEKDQTLEAPSKLRNMPYVRHFEFITKMFGLPNYMTFDPTIILSFFIPLFFGLMFSDVGYGLLLFLLASCMIIFSNPNMQILKSAGIVLTACSFTTIFFGFLFGSFFGNLFKIQPYLMDPFKSAKELLIFALGLGLLHLTLGHVIGSIIHLKNGNIKGFLYDNVPYYGLVSGAALLGLGNSYGWIGLGLSIGLFIAKNGILGVLDASGLVGTWFSYARILALSLATGGIALGINILSDGLSQLGSIGVAFGFMLLIGGHLFNFVMNLIGSSINSVRLHFIEFFSQFYEPEGKPFIAFTTKRIKDML